MSSAVNVQDRRLDLKIQKICAWCGPLFIVLYCVFWWGIADFIPPQDPAWSAQQVWDWFDQNRLVIRIGNLGALIAVVVLIPYWISVAAKMREVERSRGLLPVLSSTFLIGATINVVILQGINLSWLVCSWTDAGLDASTVESWHIMAWFLFVVPYAPYLLNLLTLGVVVFLDNRPDPWLPRWMGYFCLLELPTSVLGGFAVFFREGPFGWNGLFAFYVLVTCFAIFVCLTGVMMVVSVRRQQRLLHGADSQATDPSESPMAPVAGS